ncbi:DUF1800 domain-containing protein [Hansschlegelia zhihuaiae]|uniref:DUF1800 domain-containing protein n=1 Tax=Hansschlegelia zhihuaiae TaxID=405005 RepID=A0A4Q0MJM4_9HYPH|nr:DUF1800 domain-containing protein [Hansschlegelia zhihuaiae]RXF73758.1 DUF1800 domain-containing protein [Hansschlegelia zhihuaiae]
MTVRPADRELFEAQIALSRFGLGARPGDVARIASDPRGAAKAELLARDAALLRDPYLVSTEESARNFIERKTIRAMRNGREIKGTRQVVADMMRAEGRLPPEKKDAKPEPASAKRGSDDDMDMGGGMDRRKAAREDMKGGSEGEKRRRQAAAANLPDPPRSPLGEEAAARYVHARKVDVGFVERLVQFWGNHFTVSSRGGVYVGWIAGAFEREAIRPHALGRFSDMLLAATRHPAMLIYLDNDTSFGPKSEVGERRNKGLNENHARELLELHTVGVDGGYRQEDVIALAKALTGWRRVRRPDAKNHGAFEFDDRAHEPGPQTVMGKVYKQDGVEQGEAILADLARKPSTATHVARRLATAFVADDPPPALVDRLARTFRETDGDLKEVSLALISSDEAWDAPRMKMRSPQEFVFASLRACGAGVEPELLTKGLKTLGQPFWGATSPKGYSLLGRDWIAPDAQTNRLDLAVDIARERADDVDPNGLAEDLLGGVMSDETRTAVKRAGSREQALALLLMSPEMQRR